nr:unnamed protein product [Callosobruchus chinensis]
MRWKTLLGFSCRNRLLLSGTPIQNSMAELWALLHFIMPTLFDSHEEFNEWFSKDIENHAENKTGIDEKHLSRLHMILKPFMLRRIKKDVENELSDKIEVMASASPISLYCYSRKAAWDIHKQVIATGFNHLNRQWAMVTDKTVNYNSGQGLYPEYQNCLGELQPIHGWSNIVIPDKECLVTDSGKLSVLDGLLRKLKEEGHRVLIYSQMTKMIDLLEVIFYDSDWNPTVDQQAMDRAHRLGQTKQGFVPYGNNDPKRMKQDLILPGNILEEKDTSMSLFLDSMPNSPGSIASSDVVAEEIVETIVDGAESPVTNNLGDITRWLTNSTFNTCHQKRSWSATFETWRSC